VGDTKLGDTGRELLLLLLYMCPHTTTYVSSLLLYVSAYSYMCPHTPVYVSSYYYVCVLILLCMFLILLDVSTH
jgi:hypothetical protein